MNTAIQKKLWKDKATISLIARDIFHSYIINRQVDIGQVELSRMITNDTQQIGCSFNYKLGNSIKTRSHKNSIDGEASRAGGY